MSDDFDDHEMLDLMDLVLASNGFYTTPVNANGTNAVLAENENMVALAASTTTVDSLSEAEARLSKYLVDKLAAASETKLKWEGYVVLLTAHDPLVGSSKEVFGLTYDLRYVRRIVRTGVEPTTAGVARALRPLLPLTKVWPTRGAGDPLEDLARRLAETGIDKVLIESQLNLFRRIDRTVDADDSDLRESTVAELDSEGDPDDV
jgi:hypothetical protein